MNINNNAFVIRSAAKNKKSDNELGQRYIDVAHDWKSHAINVSTVANIENFFKTLDTNALKQII